MNIVHLCLSCFYIDGFAYQENQLVAQHVADGHKVTVVASTESFDKNRQVTYLEPADYLGTDGARVIRLGYRKLFPHKVATKIRAYPKVLEILEFLKPDVLFFHGLCAWELVTVAKYVKQHSETRLYVDCHEDFNNSARTFFSKWLLHYLYYRSIVRFCLPRISKMLCVTVESISFAIDFYGVPPLHLELYPLGGHLLPDASYNEKRSSKRAQLGLEARNLVFLQSGKLNASKQLGKALQAFYTVKDANLRFLIVGQMTPDVQLAAQPLIDADSRVKCLGWVSPDNLRDLLCAADVYVQPFGQTATTQMSLCCRCAFIAQDLPSHRALLSANGFLTNETHDLEAAFRWVVANAEKLEAMQNASANFAKQKLDYQILAKRVLA